MAAAVRECFLTMRKPAGSDELRALRAWGAVRRHWVRQRHGHGSEDVFCFPGGTW